MEAVSEISEGVRRVAAEAGGSVAGIGHRWGLGSGVVVAPGRILTNAHNLRGAEVAVTLPGGHEVGGRALGVDLDGDVAVLEAETGGAPALAWSEDGVEIGTPVFAVANPGGRGLRVTFGLVSGTARAFRGPRGRQIAGGIEHTAPLLPGSSGGPVVDAAGRLLGLNTHRLGEGFYLAIPADAALAARVEALGRGEAPSRRRLGIGVAPARVARALRRAVGLPEVDGVLVRSVEEGGPAARAGIAEGDLIVAAGGEPVTTADALGAVVEAAAGTVELTVLRGAEERRVRVSPSEGR